ncbi:hypothetical protein E3O19_01560 [Cryobacterium algoritolerans]|uniref:Uncharacterized protein n=1 Tax=Cryobacterium algoritolerans TaxID=1259184 RepID=A0A4R8X0D3_9MICO|nr:hypothetical protein [Cryobacterium algoritolerans]TFC20080.1 hypothetical protein E3O19_01560 [Cryobacterium algoritolerans]
MGVTSMLARWASKSVHVLIVGVPGWDESRMLLEAELDRRGWRVALSPADADLLAVCGLPGEVLGAASDLLWNQLPGPRTRVSVTTPVALSALLDAAVAHLVDDSWQREDARARSRPVAAEDPRPNTGEHESMSHEDMDHGDMDHGGMDMPTPGGIPLAGGGDDRDGLEMDVLNVSLGPVLPHWPAGLVVDCVLQGDVIVSAGARLLEAASAPKEVSEKAVTDVTRGRRRIIRLCDDASNLLALAGWQTAAQNARRLRDDARRGADSTDHAAALDRLRRRAERSVLLRWSLKGISLGEIGLGAGTNTGTATPDDQAAVDIRHRLIGWLREAAVLAGTSSGRQSPAAGDSDPVREAQDALEALPELLRGTDLGTARLLIAGLGLDTAALAQTHERTHD